MKTAYKVLAYLIALEVVIQAAAMAFAVAGLAIWVDEGGVFDKAAFEDENLSFTGIAGFMVHGINGMMVIPLLALLLLIVSFFAKVPGGVKYAGIVLGLVVIQVALGLYGHETPYAGMLHGLNALILFTAALYTGRVVSAESTEVSQRSEAARV
ncbi:MAG: hypothetical protein ACXWDI_04625 [Nocardioides sp.]